MAYIPKFYPGSTSVGINRRRCIDTTTDSFPVHVCWNHIPADLANVATITKEEKQKQKKIDRIAWKAERRQRYQKGRQCHEW